MNLNDIAPDVDGHDQDEDWLFRAQSHGHDAIVDVFFDDLAGHLCERLRDAYFVAGCMAKLAALYATEWSRVLALSEPLDWSSEYVAPEWRFGS